MIGIFGGSFDPIHKGHTHIARAVMSVLHLGQMHFVPCAEPVHRERPRATAEQRCAMIELALVGESGMQLNRLEIDRGGPSYTIDTLREIRRGDDRSLLLLLGADAFNDFGTWENPEGVLQLANLVICMRPGTEVNPDCYPAQRVDSVDTLQQRSSGSILLLEVEAPDCSSSGVRAALDAGEFPRYCLHPGVADYIRRHRIYRRPGD